MENFTERVMAAVVGYWALVRTNGKEVKVSMTPEGYKAEFWEVWGDGVQPCENAVLISVEFKRFNQMVDWLASEFAWHSDNL